MPVYLRPSDQKLFLLRAAALGVDVPEWAYDLKIKEIDVDDWTANYEQMKVRMPETAAILPLTSDFPLRMGWRTAVSEEYDSLTMVAYLDGKAARVMSIDFDDAARCRHTCDLWLGVAMCISIDPDYNTKYSHAEKMRQVSNVLKGTPAPVYN